MDPTKPFAPYEGTLAYGEINTTFLGNARKTTGFQAKSIDELAKDIARVGLKNRLQVWLTKNKVDGNEETICALLGGERRYRAIEQILHDDPQAFEGGQAVPVRFNYAENRAQARRMALRDNVDHQALSSYEVSQELALQVRSAANPDGLPQRELAADLGQAQSWVSTHISAFNGAKKFLANAWAKDQLPFDTIAILAALPEEEQEEATKAQLDLRAAGKKREAKQAARGKKKGKKGPPKDPRIPPTYIKHAWAVMQRATKTALKEDPKLAGFMLGIGYTINEVTTEELPKGYITLHQEYEAQESEAAKAAVAAREAEAKKKAEAKAAKQTEEATA